MIEPVIISIIIAAGGLIITAIFNSRNWYRNTHNDTISEHERAVRTETKIDEMVHKIDTLKKDNADDIADLKKSVSNDISALRSDVSNISHAASKTQLRQEKQEAKVENHEHRIHSLERWRDRADRKRR